MTPQLAGIPGLTMPAPTKPDPSTDTGTGGTGANPRPISTALQIHLDQVLTAIPTMKRGQVTVAASNRGFETGVGVRLGSSGSLAAWAGQDPSGWSVGTKGSWSW